MSNSEEGVLTLIEKNLKIMPTKEQYADSWDSITILELSNNKITELNASELPPNLTYLDLTDNPIRKILGIFPESLEDLVLDNTLLQIIPKLPPNLKHLNINNTPVGKRLIISYTITDPLTFKRIEDWGPAVEQYDILVHNVPNKNDTINFVMVKERIEKEDGLYYTVEDIHGKIKTIRKEDLNLYEPLYGDTIQPIPQSSGMPNIYTTSGHAEDLLFEKPVPPGCVYVTIEECGVPSADWEKLYFAFEDKPPGIREKLRDPVKYRVELTAHFGRAFHVHWPEAPVPEDRTYVEAIHYPVLVWDRNKYIKKEGEATKWAISKSGITSLNENIVYTKPVKRQNGSIQNTTFFNIKGNRIDESNVHFMYDDSLYPTYEQVTDSLFTITPEINITTGDTISTGIFNNHIMQFNFLQSWAFKHFPGVHYNFACRFIHPDLSKTNKRVSTRRRKSITGRMNVVSKIQNIPTQVQIGSEMLLASTSVNQPELALKLLEWPGIDINIQDQDKHTPLYWAVVHGQYEVVRELVKYVNLEDTNFALLIANSFKEREHATYERKIKEREEVINAYKLQQNTNSNSNNNSNYNGHTRINISDIPDEPVLEHKWDSIIALLTDFNKERDYRFSLIYSGGNRKAGGALNVVKKRTTRKLRKGKRT